MSCISFLQLFPCIGDGSTFLDRDFDEQGISAVDFIIPPNLSESLLYMTFMMAGVQACRVLYIIS